MRRWLKVLLGVLAALVVLLILNAIVIDHQTKSAKVVGRAQSNGLWPSDHAGIVSILNLKR